MKKRTALVLAFLLAFCFLPLVRAYSNSDYGFSITPPTGWQAQSVTGVVVAFVDPNVLATGASINVVTEATTLPLDSYVDATKEQLATYFSSYSLVSEGAVVVNGVSGYKIVSTYSQNSISVQVLQVILVKDGMAYIVSCTAFPSQYESLVGDFTASYESFRLDSQTSNPPVTATSNLSSPTPTQALTSTPTNLNPTSSNFDWVLVIAVVVVAIVVVAAATGLYLKKRKRTGDNNTYGPPPPPPPPYS